jgi:hypothetical protein
VVLRRIGHRITGNRTGHGSKRGTGWECVHVAIDDASRLAYTEMLADEKKETTGGFARRVVAWFGRNGIPRTNGKAERFIQTSLRE